MKVENVFCKWDWFQKQKRGNDSQIQLKQQFYNCLVGRAFQFLPIIGSSPSSLMMSNVSPFLINSAGTFWKPSFKSWVNSFPPRECQGLLPSPACQCQQRHSGILWKFAEIVWTTEVVLPVEIGEVVGHALRQTRLKKSKRGRQVVGHLYLVKGTTVD